MIILISLIGALTNRIRGGWLTDIARKKNWISSQEEIPYVKDFNDFVYALVFSCLIDFRYDWTALGGFLILFGSMRLGRSMGWGGYISAMIDKEIDHNRDDILLLDKWFRGNDEPILSGWAALSLRGFIWSTCLYLGFLGVKYFGYELSPNFYHIPFIGLSMGTCYLLAIEICNKITFRGNGWQWGEIIFGGVLWGSIALLIV